MSVPISFAALAARHHEIESRYNALVAHMASKGYVPAPDAWATTPEKFDSAAGHIYVDFEGEELTSTVGMRTDVTKIPGDAYYWFILKE